MIAPINDSALQAGDVTAIRLCHFAFGSFASLLRCPRHVRFTLNRGHFAALAQTTLWADFVVKVAGEAGRIA
jgi:hypothetical protein